MKRFSQLIMGAAAIVMLTGMTMTLSGCEWGSNGYNRGYQPDQPIPFSHKLHAGTYQIQCLYCHYGAERSVASNVPSLNICMNCHLVVATDSPYIQKIAKA